MIIYNHIAKLFFYILQLTTGPPLFYSFLFHSFKTSMCVICQFVNGTVVRSMHIFKKEQISQWKIHVISCDLRQNMVCTLRSEQVQNVECLPLAIENEVSCREVGTKPGLARAGINVRGLMRMFQGKTAGKTACSAFVWLKLPWQLWESKN